MLRNLEQAMLYINVAASAVLLARLYAQGLVSAYPFVFAYLFAETLDQIVASAFAQRSYIYAEIYFVSQMVIVALTVFVILELYKLALAHQPALARFGRRTLGYLFSIAVLLGLANALLEFEGPDRKRGILLLRFLRFERSMDLVAFIVLILMAGFLLWFPVRVRRNVAVWLGGFVLYSFSRWTGLLLTNRFPHLGHEWNVGVLGSWLACLIGWSVMLKRADDVFDSHWASKVEP